MRVIACLLLALLVSSALFGMCNGAAWFEGYSPQEKQELKLSAGWSTVAPFCYLILSENESHTANLTIKVSTMIMFGQTENFETWLSINSQEPQKLVGILNTTHMPRPPIGYFYNRQYDVALSGLGDGAHFIKIRVVGDYGSGGNYEWEGNASIIVDNTPPKVSFLALENKTFIGSVPLDFITNEQFSQATYSLDGQENVTINANATLTGLSEGDHNLTVYATDEAGNVGASETIYFSIFPTTLAIAVVTVAVIGIVLLVYFKKRKY
jgi:hypothetical protein